jgi:Zn-dependent protease with chaperone function
MSAARTRAYLISPDDLNPSWMLLYLVTLVLAAGCGYARYWVSEKVIWLPNRIEHWGLPIHNIAVLIGFGPLIFSLATLVLPFGGWFWEQDSGARSPSGREQLVFDEAFAELSKHNPSLRPPRRWCVLEDPELNAAAYADTLMVNRGLMESPFFTAVLGHELGHLNTSDSRLSAALCRMTTSPRRRYGFPFKTVGAILNGQAGMAIVSRPWAMYFRARELKADTYSHELGQKAALQTFLDTHVLDGDLPTPFKGFGWSSHPWTEHRIDNLEAHG